MKKIKVLILVLILVSFSFVKSYANEVMIKTEEKQGEQIKWFSNLDKAKAESKKSGLPMLLNFTGSDWCGWCIKLESEIFSKKEFVDLVKDKIIFVKLDFPSKKEIPDEEKKINAAARDKYEVKGFPTILVVDSEGKKIGQSGYKKITPAEYAKELLDMKPMTNLEKVKKGQWLSNFNEAKEIAKTAKLPILLDFTGSDWCGWCVKIDNEIFSKKEFIDFVAGKIVLVKLDFPRKKEIPEEEKKINAEAAKKFEVQGFPTIIVLDKEEKNIGTLHYMKDGAGAFVEALDKILNKVEPKVEEPK